jgi:hypothetical protein
MTRKHHRHYHRRYHRRVKPEQFQRIEIVETMKGIGKKVLGVIDNIINKP